MPPGVEQEIAAFRAPLLDGPWATDGPVCPFPGSRVPEPASFS